jgi:hypothetical protein
LIAPIENDDATAAASANTSAPDPQHTVRELKPPLSDGRERLSSDLSDREVKRKEIQALIEKYAGLDEQATSQEASSVLAKCQQKYSAVLSTVTADLVDAVAKAVSFFLFRYTGFFDCMRLCVLW